MSTKTTAAAPAPLDGIRVLDLTSTMSGPFCTLLLAQLGASVDKIEPASGDVVRHLTPGRTPGMSPIFLALNAGKRSVILDFGDDSDREHFRRALPHYDVVVHNMRPQAAVRIGLTIEAMAEAGRNALLCELVGYGPGPYQDKPAYDDTIQAISGLAWVQGNGIEPEYVRTAVADKTAGLFAATAICAELVARAAGAPGRSIKIPMFESIVAFTTVEQLGGLTFEPALGTALYPRTASPYRRPYRTLDGYLSLMLYTDRHWAAFLRHIARDELIADHRFASLSGRTAHIDLVYALVAEELTRRTTAEWLKALGEIDVPHAPVNSLDDLLEDDHLAAVELFSEVEHPTEGWIRTVRAPFLFNGLRTADLAPAPTLGQHTATFVASNRPPVASDHRPRERSAT